MIFGRHTTYTTMNAARLIFAGLLWLTINSSLSANTINIPADRPTIQEGLNDAQTGDTVLVANGTYTGLQNTDLDYLGKSIVLVSQFGADSTIIDCQNVEFRRGIYFHSGEDSLAKIVGFTIKRGAHRGGGIYAVGSSPTIEACRISSNYSYHGGAAIRCDSGASVTIRNCTFAYNYSGVKEKAQGKKDGNFAVMATAAYGQGGALCVDSGSSAYLQSCIFRYNSCDEMGGAAYVRFGLIASDSCTYYGNSVFGSTTGGGAVFVDSGGAVSTFTNCSFTNNHSGEANGGAIVLRNSSPVFSDCIIDSNYCWQGKAGAIFAINGSAGQFSNCDIIANYNQSGFGGAIYCRGASPAFDLCIIRDNYCSPYGFDGGGGAACADTASAPQLIRCTVVRNYTTDSLPGAAILSIAANPSCSASIVALNGDGDVISGSIALYCSDVWGNAGGDWTDSSSAQRLLSGNLCVPPRFCDTLNSEFSLASNSQCLAANNLCGLTMGAESTICPSQIESIHVDSIGNDTSGSGTVDFPYATIQKGLDEFLGGDSVIVHPGTYSGIGNHGLISSGREGVLVGIAGKDSTTIVLAPGAIGIADTILPFALTLDGFTFRGGARGVDAHISGSAIRNCRFDSIGTAIHARSMGSSQFESITVSHCDTAIALPPSDTAALTIANATFLANVLALHGTDTSRNSLAVVIESSSLDSCGLVMDMSATVRQTSFQDCGSITGEVFPSIVELDSCQILSCIGTAIGTGLSTTIANTLIEGCLDTIAVMRDTVNDQFLTFRECRLTDNGGGIAANGTGPHLSIVRTLFANNSEGIDFAEGLSGNLMIDSSTVAQNAMSISSSSNLEILRCIIAFNGDSGIRVISGDSIPAIMCNNVFGNVGSQYAGISDPTGIDGNLSVDPIFCDTALGQFTLLDTSWCIASHNACSTQIGAYGAGCAFPIVDSIRVDTIGNNTHVLSNTPVLYWYRGDSLSGTQTSFEIAFGSDSEWSFSEYWNPAPIFTTDSSLLYAGAPLNDGDSGYLRLRLTAGGRTSDWRTIQFRLNSVPTTPTILNPLNDSIVPDATPLFWLTGSIDPESDSLQYEIQCGADSSFAIVEFWDSLISQQLDSTSHEASSALEENHRCYLRARSFDRFEYSPWSATKTFRVNAVDEPPLQVASVGPPDSSGRPVFDMLPLFDWLPSNDPDPGDSVAFYRLELSINPTFTFSYLVDSIAGTEWEVADSLLFSLEYWWRVSAIDVEGLSSPASEVKHFWTWTLGDFNDSHSCNIVDLTYMVSFLFQGGAPISPRYTGDLNRNCATNIVDLTYLVNYLFKEGSAPQIGCGPAK